MDQEMGKLLIILGVLIAVVGIILVTSGGTYFSWIGNLPGDISIERENFSLYIPLATMLIFSLLLSLVFWLVR